MNIAEWFEGRLPEWFDGTPQVQVDREEIIVVGRLPETEAPSTDELAEGRIARFREETRAERMRIADEAESKFERKVGWGASFGDVTVRFTTMSIPVMTRLRQPERLVLDTLVAAGVARSRSDALAWCVRLVHQHEGEWISSLQEALTEVERLRAQGPDRVSDGKA